MEFYRLICKIKTDCAWVSNLKKPKVVCAHHLTLKTPTVTQFLIVHNHSRVLEVWYLGSTYISEYSYVSFWLRTITIILTCSSILWQARKPLNRRAWYVCKTKRDSFRFFGDELENSLSTYNVVRVPVVTWHSTTHKFTAEHWFCVCASPGLLLKTLRCLQMKMISITF